MFIKITKSGPYEYAYLVRSYREDNTTKHEYLFNLGRLDQIEGNKSFQNLAKRLLELSQAKDMVSLATFSEAQILNWGYIVYQKIWQEFGLDNLLFRLKDSGKTQFDLSKTCFLMTIQHLLAPQSKLSTYTQQNRYLGLPEVKLQHLYRSLDLLAESKEVLGEELFFKLSIIIN